MVTDNARPRKLPSIPSRLSWIAPTPRRTPVTFGYLAFLCAGYVVVYKIIPIDQARHFLISISTTVPAIESRPLVALAGSMLVLPPPLVSVSGFMTLVVGIAWSMGTIERRHGTSIAVATFVAGHVGASLITTAVKIAGVSAHRYDASVLSAYDFGPSFGVVCATTAALPFLPALVRPVWLLTGICYLLSAATWYGPVPDFTTIGHLCAVIIGLVCAGALHRGDHGPAVRDMDVPAASPSNSPASSRPGR